MLKWLCRFKRRNPVLVAIPLMLLSWDAARSFDLAGKISDIASEISNLFKGNQPLFRIDRARIWPTYQIPVCWTQDVPPSIDERAWVRDAVQKFIESNSDYRFNGWDSVCANANSPVIKISVQDAVPLTSIGYPGTGPTPMRLNFIFSAWGNSCASVAIRADNEPFREHCIRTIAVHEFLHALGALHEQLDPDLAKKDPDCFKIYHPEADCLLGKDACGENPSALTKYDHDSIMNYCRNGTVNAFYNLPLQLSIGDIDGLKKLSAMTGLALKNNPDR
jgi:hypothetical protein